VEFELACGGFGKEDEDENQGGEHCGVIWTSYMHFGWILFWILNMLLL
jgi:hypothetical protein